jgi:hypothetical protein
LSRIDLTNPEAVAAALPEVRRKARDARRAAEVAVKRADDFEWTMFWLCAAYGLRWKAATT